MKRLTPDSPELKSADLVAENIERLRELFPEAFANEGKIDFDVLRQLLGDRVDDGEERYGLNWHGKRAARQLALTPSTGTLRPCPEESVDWDTTQNIFIEGDNLEVLKLLQKSYAGKVKLIYIDPPYNTGKDFVYPDNFQDSIKNYLELTGQIEGRQRITSNTEASGRFHTDWLNMMYPRIKLARTLLASSGLLLVSTDETEADNAKAICDSIFGADCFVERIVWKNKYGAGAMTKGFANVHEYILVYSREPIEDLAAPLNDEQRAQYKLRDEHYETRGGYITQPLATTSKDPRPNLVFPIVHEGREIWPDKQWVWSKDRVDEAYRKNQLVINETDGRFSVRAKQYLRDENGHERLGKPLSLMNGPFNQEGTGDIAALFTEKVFSFPKPVALIQYFVALVVNSDESRDGLYLDFFAGSGTTCHAVMAQNALDGGARRFLAVQLPEPLNEGVSEQSVAAAFCKKHRLPLSLTSLTKERLRRAAKHVREQHPSRALDLGFRVYALDTGNVRPWEASKETLSESLAAAVDHVKSDRTEDDLLYDIILKHGLDLCAAIDEKQIGGHKVRSVGGGAVFACFGSRITAADVEQLADGIAKWRDDLAPANPELSRVVFRDSAFETDVAKTNLALILKERGFDEKLVVSL